MSILFFANSSCENLGLAMQRYSIWIIFLTGEEMKILWWIPTPVSDPEKADLSKEAALSLQDYRLQVWIDV